MQASASVPPATPGPVLDQSDHLRMRHVLHSLRTSLATALIAHSGVGLLFAAVGHPLLGLLAFAASVAFDQLLTRRSVALLSVCGEAPRRVMAELSVLVLTRSMLAAALLLGLMLGQGFGGSFYPIALLGVVCSVFVVQLGLAPRLVLLACAPMLATIVYVGFRVQNHLPPLGVWATIATVIMTCSWLAIYSWRAQSKTLRLIQDGRVTEQKLRDTLARIEAEATIREMLEREVGLGFYDADIKTARVRWSPGVFKAYGRKEVDEAPSISDVATQVAGGQGHALAREYLHGVLQGHTVVQHYPVIGDDGQQRHVRTIGVPIKDETGRVVRLYGAVVDETEQARMLQESQAVERRLKAALSVGLSVLWEFDLVQGQSFSLGATSHFVGSEQPDHAIYDAILSRLTPETQASVMEVVKTAARSRTRQVVEHQMAFANGQQGWVRTVIESRFRTDGPGLALITGFTTDITEEVVRREALASALDAAEAASHSKSSFLANMSHEIRTPLHGILAVADMLAHSDLDPRQTEMMGLIQASGNALSTVVNDVLDLARVESGRLEINWQPVDLVAVVSSASNLFHLKAVEKGITLQLDLSAANGVQVSADPVRLGQIVSNLVSNAVKFTRHGSVLVRVACEPAESGDGNRVQVAISVQDTGPGIPQDRLSSLFNRFEQLDGSITREHGGSGLGLSIAQGLAQHMGGVVDVDSIEGLGTTFTVRLELDRLQAPDLPVAADSAAAGAEPDGTLRVLAADDHATNREVIRLILEPMGVELTLCVNGLEAVEAYKTKAYDLVLMDLQMPVMDGLTAVRAMRAHELANGLPPVPIAAVTANAMDHHRQEAEAAGANSHIAKPFSPQQLLDGISHLLELAQPDTSVSGECAPVSRTGG
jgi:signal transduction histidine kinase/CheY-like chemotaxis protein